MSNGADVCGDSRHKKIAYAFDGVNVTCPVCKLLDEREELDERVEILKEFLEEFLDEKEEK